MRKIFLLFAVVLMLLNILAADSLAADMDTRLTSLGKTPVNKLVRGIVNCFTFIVELPASVCDVGKRKGVLAGATIGLADGIATSFLRLGTGVFDTVTFLIPPYDKPILKPEFAIDSAIDKMGPSTNW